MGLGVLAVFIGPLLVTQVAFRRYAGIRATYLQTVRSLARVTEVAGYVETGHSRRVSRLAVSVGRGLGMPEPDLLALEYAALMHDIGQLSLRDPIPGGATVLVSPADQDRIAELGAEVIREAGVLDDVADLVRCQSWPAHGHDPAPPLGSMIIRAANAFDDMVGGSTDRDRSAAALERLRLDPIEYDAGVVDGAGRGRGPPGRRPGCRLPGVLESVLVANRGEIARRVIATARRLGIRSVAVYSEADADLPFVREADEAVLIGPAQPASSYLNGPAVLAAAQQTGAARHPPRLRLPGREPGVRRQRHRRRPDLDRPGAERRWSRWATRSTPGT